MKVFFIFFALVFLTSFVNDVENKTYWLCTTIVEGNYTQIFISEIVEAPTKKKADFIFRKALKDKNIFNREVIEKTIQEDVYEVRQIWPGMILKGMRYK